MSFLYVVSLTCPIHSVYYCHMFLDLPVLTCYIIIYPTPKMFKGVGFESQILRPLGLRLEQFIDCIKGYQAMIHFQQTLADTLTTSPCPKPCSNLCLNPGLYLVLSRCTCPPNSDLENAFLRAEKCLLLNINVKESIFSYSKGKIDSPVIQGHVN